MEHEDVDMMMLAAHEPEAEEAWWRESSTWPGYSHWQVKRWYAKRARRLVDLDPNFCVLGK